MFDVADVLEGVIRFLRGVSQNGQRLMTRAIQAKDRLQDIELMIYGICVSHADKMTHAIRVVFVRVECFAFVGNDA